MPSISSQSPSTCVSWVGAYLFSPVERPSRRPLGRVCSTPLRCGGGAGGHNHCGVFHTAAPDGLRHSIGKLLFTYRFVSRMRWCSVGSEMGGVAYGHVRNFYKARSF